MILFLAANPGGAVHLGLDREARAIQDELERSGLRDCFEFETRWAVTPLDLLRVLRKLKPTVVHFAGHGGRSPVGEPADEVPRRDVAAWPPQGEPQRHGLFLDDRDGRARFVSTTALEKTFSVVGASVKLVVLNACYSAPIAEALVVHVDCVVGMAGSISDDAARAFAVGFYGALADRASVAAAYEQGKAAIGLEVLNELPDRERPQLKVRVGSDAARRGLTLDGLARRIVRTVGIDVRAGMYLSGAFGISVTCMALVATALIAYRMWSAFGESTLDVRVQELTVRASQPPQPVQDNAEVRAIEAHASIIESAQLHASASAEVHRVTLAGAFASIEIARPASDPACQLRFAVHGGGIAIERATAEGTACRHDVAVVAGTSGLTLVVDDDPAVVIAPHDRVVLRMKPGTPVTLVPRNDRLALFRPADNVVWTATAMEGNTAPGDRVHLPGALRRSDSFELEGAIELQEMRFDAGRLVVLGVVRDWHGSVGRAEDWDSGAPWPRGRYCWLMLASLALLVILGLGRTRARWRAWETESE